MVYEVENFYYDGFIVKSMKGKAPYKATFLHWTVDPGVAKCQCSDGKKRLIPSCQLINFSILDVPKQKKTRVKFGKASSSL